MRVFREKEERTGGRDRGARGFFGRGGSGGGASVGTPPPDPALRDVFAAPEPGIEAPEGGAPFWDGPSEAPRAPGADMPPAARQEPDPARWSAAPSRPAGAFGEGVRPAGIDDGAEAPDGPGAMDPGPFVARARMASRPRSRAQDWPVSRPVEPAPGEPVRGGPGDDGMGSGPGEDPAPEPGEQAAPRQGSKPRRIWDIEAEAQARPPTPQAAPLAQTVSPDPHAPPGEDAAAIREDVALARAQVARMAAGGGAGAGTARAKTRLLGFHAHDLAGRDPFSRGARDGTQPGPRFPVGWVVVTEGPGRGASFALTGGVASIGRGADQAIALDFGDVSISRQGHASIAYDEQDNRFYLGHGGKANLVRLNGRPVVSTEDLADGDEIAIGETVLRFVALCGGAFAWAAPEHADGPQGPEAQDDGRQ